MKKKIIKLNTLISAQAIFAKYYNVLSNIQYGGPLKQNTLETYIFRGIDLLPSLSSIIVYAATIGELRAAGHFIKCLFVQYPESQLILISAQSQYADAFLALYPEAVVMSGAPPDPATIDILLKNANAKMCLFIEGPSLHGFFPIRQDLSLAAGCLRHKVPMFVINACLYEGMPISSHYDWVENIFFSRILSEGMVRWYAPNQAIQQQLISHNLTRSKIVVTGDIKLDNVLTDARSPVYSELNELFKHYQENSKRLIVAGSVNEFEEQAALIVAWLAVRAQISDIVMVLAPRYVNDKSMMNRLFDFLGESGVSYALRSMGVESIKTHELLIIDVFGELPYFYAEAEIAFAGRGHGVVEPMRYGKPVVIGPRDAWEKVTSTAYHLFEHLLDENALIESTRYDLLEELFLKLLREPDFSRDYIERYRKVIGQEVGASDRILSDIGKYLEKLQAGTD